MRDEASVAIEANVVSEPSIADEAGMAKHYFHCTDGDDLVLDRRGRTLSGPARIERYARAVATRVMADLPDYPDWANWQVCVQHEGRQVAVIPFLPDPDEDADAPEIEAARTASSGARSRVAAA